MCGVFFADSLPSPATVSELPKFQPAKRGKYYQQKPSHFNKTAICNHRCPLMHPAPSLGHWGTRYTFRSSIQARAIPPPSRGSAHSVTTGSLLSLKWMSPPSTAQKRLLRSLIMVVFGDFCPKRCCLKFTFVDI